MNLFLSIVIHTANILGIFNDPFEFEGDYGREVNPIREQVFELVVSRKALAKHLSDLEIREKMESRNANEEVNEYKKFLIIQAVDEEKIYGPTLGELVTPELIEEIKKHLDNLSNRGFTESDFGNILSFGNQVPRSALYSH